MARVPRHTGGSSRSPRGIGGGRAGLGSTMPVRRPEDPAPPWLGPWHPMAIAGVSGLGGGLNTLSANTSQELRVSNTIVGSRLPIMLGSAKVTGQLMAGPHDDSGTLRLAYALCEGEVNSISTIKLNGEAIADLDWVDSYSSYTGTTSQSVDTNLANLSGWESSYPGIAYVSVAIDLANAQSPGIPTLTAVVDKGSVSDWGATSRDTSNPVVALWSYVSDSEIGRGWSASDIDTTSWEACRTWCDGSMTDSTNRWTVNGAVMAGYDEDLIELILRHFFGRLWKWDGKWYMSCYKTMATADHTLTESSGHFVKTPPYSRTPYSQRPTTVVAHGIDGSTWKDCSRMAHSDNNATTERRVDLRLDLCTSPSMLARYAAQYKAGFPAAPPGGRKRGRR